MNSIYDIFFSSRSPRTLRLACFCSKSVSTRAEIISAQKKYRTYRTIPRFHISHRSTKSRVHTPLSSMGNSEIHVVHFFLDFPYYSQKTTTSLQLQAPLIPHPYYLRIKKTNQTTTSIKKYTVQIRIGDKSTRLKKTKA